MRPLSGSIRRPFIIRLCWSCATVFKWRPHLVASSLHLSRAQIAIQITQATRELVLIDAADEVAPAARAGRSARQPAFKAASEI